MSYYIWRCPECKKQLDQRGNYTCGCTGERDWTPERVEIPSEPTDEMVTRARWALNDAETAYDWIAAKEALLAAGPWTCKPDRENMIKAMIKQLAMPPIFHGGSIERQRAERIVNALLEVM